MQAYVLADTIKKHLPVTDPVGSFLIEMPESKLGKKFPEDMILFTAEFFYHPECVCEIVLLIADESVHIGRKEKYENCIFSHYTGRKGETIVLNNVKTHPSFLELDPRINAEIFCECKISGGLSLILNMECSSDLISDEASFWFSQVKEKVFLPQ